MTETTPEEVAPEPAPETETAPEGDEDPGIDEAKAQIARDGGDPDPDAPAEEAPAEGGDSGEGEPAPA